MALGGGTFLAQNKILPGGYINFVSAARASAAISDRGTATMPLELDWGADDAVFTVTAEEFRKNSLKIFGYPYTHEKLKGLRDLFKNIVTGHFFKLNCGGERAANSLATARCRGARGNALRIVIEENVNSTTEAPVYDVSTFLETVCVDVQTAADTAELKPNDFVEFISAAVLAPTASAPLSGGTDGAAGPDAYQRYLDRIEGFAFNTMGCLSAEPAVKSLFVDFTKRMRDTCGVKFQTVLFRPDEPDYEGIIGVENGLADDKNSPALIWWVTGAEAGCAVNKSLTNRAYDGEFAADTDYTQAELEAGLSAGRLMLHRVGDSTRVLDDRNSFTGVSEEKSADFSGNQTIRVLDQIGNDVAVLFNTKYLGKVPNDNAGRISLWNDIVKHHQALQTVRAIEDFSGECVTVAPGETKRAVVVTDRVTPVCAMAQLYMTIIVQ